MNRSEARVIIMTILYQIFMYENNKIDYKIEDIIKENLPIDNDFVKSMVSAVLDNKKDLEKKANEYLKDWNINRLGLTDQAILCLGIYELLYTDTPHIVSINEAIELAKDYSDEEVVKMINAVLDKIYKAEVLNE